MSYGYFVNYSLLYIVIICCNYLFVKLFLLFYRVNAFIQGIKYKKAMPRENLTQRIYREEEGFLGFTDFLIQFDRGHFLSVFLA